MGTAKDDVATELAELVAGPESGLAHKEIIEILQARERQGPFSMGKCLAFLHGRTDKAKDFMLALGTAPQGLDFQAPDGRLIRLVILMVVPKKRSNLYLYTMGSFLNLFSNEANVQRAAAVTSSDAMVRLFEELESAARTKSPLEELIQPTPFLRVNQTMGQAVEVVLGSKVEQIPVVGAGEELLGEITLTTLLKLASSNHKDRRLEELGPEALTQPKVVVEDTLPMQELAERLSRESSSVAYVVRGRRLIGQINPVELLRRMIAR